ncbi:GntR family transcriptional regulator [Thermodesulfobacteriota bacterium]
MLKNNAAGIDTKTSFIYKSLKSDIIKARLKPGEKLVVSKLSKQFGVSIIPVREALNQLNAEGFVDRIPHTGIYVKDLDIDYLKQVYPIRGILEGYAISNAIPLLSEKDVKKLQKIIKRLDTRIKNKNFKSVSELNYDFHMTIYRPCGNDQLIKMIDDLIDNTARVRIIFDLMPERAAVSNREHKNILEAILKKQRKKAAQLVDAHIQETLNFMVQYMETH